MADTFTDYVLKPGPHLMAGVVLFGVVWGFFKGVEGVLSQETIIQIWMWLGGVQVGQTVARWPDTFADVFDRVFGKKHLSWKCFGRSCLATVASSLICTIALLEQIRLDRRAMTDRLTSVVVNFNIPYWLEGILLWRIVAPTSAVNATWYSGYHGWRTTLPIAAFALLVGIWLCGFDYVSLLTTRYCVGLLKRTTTAPALVSILLLDLILTGMVGMIPGYLANFGATLHPFSVYAHKAHEEHRILTEEYDKERAMESQLGSRPSPALESFEIEGWAQDRRRIFQLVAPWLPTFFTSIWLWLYAGAGFLLKGAHRFDKFIGWFNHFFDIEKHPLSSIGLVAGSLTATIYWVAVGVLGVVHHV